MKLPRGDSLSVSRLAPTFALGCSFYLGQNLCRLAVICSFWTKFGGSITSAPSQPTRALRRMI
jgi:hypothetical protein